MSVLRITGYTQSAQQPATLASHRDVVLLANFVILICLSSGKAQRFWFYHAMDLLFVLPILPVRPLTESRGSGEHARGSRLHRLSDGVTLICTQFARAHLYPPYLPDSGVAPRLHHQVSAHPRVTRIDRHSDRTHLSGPPQVRVWAGCGLSSGWLTVLHWQASSGGGKARLCEPDWSPKLGPEAGCGIPPAPDSRCCYTVSRCCIPPGAHGRSPAPPARCRSTPD
jgi:hypothetical protein